MKSQISRLATVLVTAATVLVPSIAATPISAAAASSTGCAADAKGGSWGAMGHDLSNTRSQPAEKKIGTAEALDLEASWTFSSSSQVGEETGPGGDFQSTVNVVDGCVYGASATGAVFAINSKTGKALWMNTQLAGGQFGMTVAGPRILTIVSGPKGPYTAALSRKTGKVLWKSKVIDKGPSGSSNASAVVYDGLLFAGFSETGGEIAAPEGGANYRGGYAIVDVRTGKVLVDRYVIPDRDNKKGFGGAGIWSTAVVSPKTGYLYVGAGNPFGRKEHKYSNSILKIDMNRKRGTFGDIVGYQHGNPDQYQAALAPMGDLPTCTASNLPTTFEHPECGQIDLDFGAAPNLFVDSKGREMVGTLQKSGVYHAVYTSTMKEAWSTIVGGPCALCNADATAFDGDKVYAVGAPGGVLVAINKDDGSVAWRSPVADGTHYEAVSVANGVVYTTDTKANLDTFDAATGLPVFSRPMMADSGGASCTALSGGVAIAEEHVIAACGGTLIAYGWDAEG